MRPMMTIPVNASESTGASGYGSAERNPTDVVHPEKCQCDPPPGTLDESLKCLACGHERMLWEDLDHRRAKMTDLLRKILAHDHQP